MLTGISMEEKKELKSITKSTKYRVGICSITEIVGKERKLDFDKGLKIEVTLDEYEKIKKLGYIGD